MIAHLLAHVVHRVEELGHHQYPAVHAAARQAQRVGILAGCTDHAHREQLGRHAQPEGRSVALGDVLALQRAAEEPHQVVVAHPLLETERAPLRDAALAALDPPAVMVEGKRRRIHRAAHVAERAAADADVVVLVDDVLVEHCRRRG